MEIDFLQVFGCDDDDGFLGFALKHCGIIYKFQEIQERGNFNTMNITRGAGPEKEPHLRLKALAAKLLRQEGETDSIFEGKGYDVFAPNLNIRVECGQTKPSRAFNFLSDEDNKEFWQIPYLKNGKTRLYKFKRGRKRFWKIYHDFLLDSMKEMAKRM